MRLLVAAVLVGCAAAAATLALGAAFAADRPDPAPATIRLAAAPKPLAGLNATFRRLAPDARCTAGAAKATQARRLRAAANRNAAKAAPKVLRAKKAKLRRAIAALRAAKKLCDAAAPGGGTTPGTPPPPPPPPPGVRTLAFTGTNFVFSPAAPIAASAGAPMRLQVTNGTTDTDHRIGVRGLGQPPIAESPIAAPGASQSVDVTLPAGVYEIFCSVDGHDMLGMIVDLNVNP